MGRGAGCVYLRISSYADRPRLGAYGLDGHALVPHRTALAGCVALGGLAAGRMDAYIYLYVYFFAQFDSKTHALALKDYIQRAKQGDQEAFRYLLNKYWADVYRFQKSLINNENEAEDITIETFARAFDKIGSFNEKYAFKNWLLTISKNIYLDKNKRKKRIDQSASLDDYPNLLNLADHSHEDDEILESKLSDLKKALAALKPAYRQVLELYYFQNLSYKEISEKTNVSLSNVKIRLMRAKKLLAGKLKKP